MFLVGGLPQSYLIKDDRFFVAEVAENIRTSLLKLASVAPGLKSFIDGLGKAPLYVIGVSDHLAVAEESAINAWRTAAGILDCYSLMHDATPPKLCSYFLLRTADSPDASLYSYTPEGMWAAIGPRNPESQKAWNATKEQFSQRLLKLFDTVGAESFESASPLTHQLLYSVRLFRHGADPNAFGVQFLLKFSALEGLVCGPETRNKEKLLTSRLGSLFRGANLLAADQVKDLWQLRCTASHQAKAFEIPEDPDTVNHASHINLLDTLFRGVLVFALDRRDSAKTVDELWSGVSSYALPPFASAQRPADMPRLAMMHFLMKFHVGLSGSGQAFDTCRAQLQAAAGQATNDSASPTANQGTLPSATPDPASAPSP